MVFIENAESGSYVQPITSVSVKHCLVGGFSPSEKYESDWILSRSRGEHPKIFELPPPSCDITIYMSHEKNRLTFHYTGWLIGILIMVYYNPYITG